MQVNPSSIFSVRQWTVPEVTQHIAKHKEFKAEEKKVQEQRDEDSSVATDGVDSDNECDVTTQIDWDESIELDSIDMSLGEVSDASVTFHPQKIQEEQQRMTYELMRKKPVEEQNAFYLGLAQEQQEKEVLSSSNLRSANKSSYRPKEEKKEILGFEMGLAKHQNLRPYMEDKSFAGSVTFTVDNVPYQVPVIGVFDGHGSPHVARFAKKNLAPIMQACFEYKGNEELSIPSIVKGLKRTFKWLDRLPPYQNYAHGTTATVAMLVKDHLFVANAGDSRAVFCQDNFCQTMSVDHKPTHPFIQEDIENRLKGKIEFYKGLNRVNRILAVGRSLGDWYIKGAIGQCCISAEPFVTYRSFPQESGAVILGSDGLWDKITAEEAAKAFAKWKTKHSIERVATKIMKAAIEKGSSDNISVVILQKKAKHAS